MSENTIMDANEELKQKHCPFGGAAVHPTINGEHCPGFLYIIEKSADELHNCIKFSFSNQLVELISIRILVKPGEKMMIIVRTPLLEEATKKYIKELGVGQESTGALHYLAAMETDMKKGMELGISEKIIGICNTLIEDKVSFYGKINVKGPDYEEQLRTAQSTIEKIKEHFTCFSAGIISRVLSQFA